MPFDKIVKGYKVDDEYVIMDEHDFEDAAPEKSKVITIESFVDVDEVNPMFYETSYYTEPDTKNNKAYGLLLQALIKSKKRALPALYCAVPKAFALCTPLKMYW
nr:Ku protein [Mucilaginibacter humi]